MIKYIVIGTAGHIDHGKTQLTKALTGIDTDRLPEEKTREMSIDLGFAPFKLTDTIIASIVDVPGHEKFIKNMVTGVSGIDMVLFTIAADDGVMPQTIEHMQILDLLGLKDGIIALTKTDLVDEDTTVIVKEEIKELVASTFLKDVPIIPVSVVNNMGIEDLKAAIINLAEKIKARNSSGIFRLPIDRVFTMSGFGTVITGTLISGSVKTGTQVEVLPGAKKSRVRGIQVQNQLVGEAFAGQRTALNLADIDKSPLMRGNTITLPGLLEDTRIIDVQLKLLSSMKKPIKNWTRVRFHIGTSEIMARIKLLEKGKLESGTTAFVQFRLEKPTVAVRGDRFIIRSYSPQTTIGGGTILDPYADRHRKVAKEILERLKTIAVGDSQETILYYMGKGYGTHKILQKRLQLTDTEFDALIQNLIKKDKVKLVRHYIIRSNWFQNITKVIIDKISSTHKELPLKAWIPKDKIRAQVNLEPEVFSLLLSEIPDIELKGDGLRLVGWKPQISVVEKTKRDEIENVFLNSGFSPPSFSEDALFQTLVNDGILVKVSDKLFFHKQCIEDAKQQINKFISQKGSATASELKALLKTTRKYAIPLLEYLDRVKFTTRKGDVRVLFSEAKASHYRGNR